MYRNTPQGSPVIKNENIKGKKHFHFYPRACLLAMRGIPVSVIKETKHAGKKLYFDYLNLK